jgi:hypothetical protein
MREENKVEDPKIIKPEQIDDIEPDLPSAGYARDEELKKRTDNLDAAAEFMSDDQEFYGLDPKAFEEDREILAHLDELHISDPDPNFEYLWAYFGMNGRVVWQRKREGWKVVSGDDPEAIELKDADGFRKIGDALLMKIPRERYNQIEAEREKRRLSQQLGIDARLIELGDKAAKHGIKVHTDPGTIPAGRGKKTLMEVMKARHARQMATQHRDKLLKTGKVPGMPSPGQ